MGMDELLDKLYLWTWLFDSLSLSKYDKEVSELFFVIEKKKR